jgi:hypothetical protein
LKRSPLAITEEEALSFVQIAKDGRFEQPQACTKPFAELHQLMRLHGDDADDARHLRTLAFGFESILPTRIDATHALAEAFETIDQPVRWSKSALTVLLSFTGGLLVTFVYGAPLAGARNVQALFNTKLIATAGADTALSRRLLAVSLVLNSDAGTGGLACIDVVSRVATTNRLEDAGAIAARGAGNTPVAVCVSRHALIAYEAILG